ncbi:uncharacterized protein DUF3830 [Desulfitobacterium sp. LBE]|uniref:DUF3830 family protein n=1 Tax=Desulfitobacterium sp. LBE TaxID=884086 RepID=UPI00119B6B92|nr:DUF3830 family protein [Desulfitobacterium sp. LBE]TWH58128.1 uncharacterized protein DUF3830 [Desulfitobacterium sp. LBE]
MTSIKITSGKFTFIGRLEEEKCPKTCEWFLNLLPYKETMIHVSWSGQASFIRLEDLGHNVPFENATSRPSKGEVLMYPGNIPYLQMSGEIYLSWGGNVLACPNGNLAGNHFMTIIEGNEQLAEFGNTVHLHGGQEIVFEKIED